MATDIKGSTGTTAALDRKDYTHFRKNYERLVVPILKKHSGFVFKALGDGYLASFESSTNAVLAGLRVQEQLHSLTRTFQLDERFATRVGISSGDVDIVSRDRFGVPVILATRLQSIAQPGATYITESVFLTMNRNEVSAEDLGYVSLKGFEERFRIFRVSPKRRVSWEEEVAVLCTDIAGFTGSLENKPLPWLEEALSSHDEIVFQHALRHNGFFRYNVGDMFIITFQKASEALEAAMGMAKDFEQVNEQWQVKGAPRLPFIFGLDFGPVRLILGRVYGLSVSRIAPHVAQLGHGIAVSLAFWEKMAEEDVVRVDKTRILSRDTARYRGLDKPIEFLVLGLP